MNSWFMPIFLCLALLTRAAWAGGDHDHSHDHAEPPVAEARAVSAISGGSADAPWRFVAGSDHTEVVGVLQGRQLTLYIDHAADNRPLEGATSASRVRLTVKGRELPLRAQAPGTFSADWPEPLLAGDHAVSVRVQAEGRSEQLDTVLRLPGAASAEPDHDEAHAHGHGDNGFTEFIRARGPWGLGAVVWLLAGLLALVLAGIGPARMGLVFRAWRARRRAGARAWLVASLAVGLAGAVMLPEAQASPGHDHGDEAPGAAVAEGLSPRRLPDGRVFLPKPVQRQWVLRTQPVRAVHQARSLELPGQVQMDPQAGGRVQALVAGRLQPGPQGFPTLGQTVRKGQLLAEVVPALGTLDRSGQQAQLAALKAALAQAERRVQRLQALSDTVPAKEREAAGIEAAGLQAQVAAVSQGLQARDALRAPVSGVIASAQAVAGQVVDAGALVFEVVDPQRLRIEALVHDPAHIALLGATGGAISRAWVQVAEQSVALHPLGVARSLRDQALPLAFAAQGPGLSGLAVGQTVRVWVQAGGAVSGHPVPAAAVQRNASNLSIVWIKQSPEHFEPRVVTTEPLDGAQVRVTSGLRDGDRVVTQGASLLNQTR
jgi:biotin carboxyl carrier protein